MRDAAEILNKTESWYPAIDSGGGIRDGAWIAEATGLADLGKWPTGTRLALRKERPHPGAQLRFTDSDGLRITAFITDTPAGVIDGQLAGLELRHRQHARVEDRIRQAKATGLRNLPCHAFDANAAWIEIILAATDLIAWTKLIGFTSHPELATCEIETFRYRVLHVAARITRSARQTRLRLDKPGTGPPPSPPPGSASAPHSPDPHPTIGSTRKTNRPWKARPTWRHRRLRRALPPEIRHHQPALPDHQQQTHRYAKSRLVPDHVEQPYIKVAPAQGCSTTGKETYGLLVLLSINGVPLRSFTKRSVTERLSPPKVTLETVTFTEPSALALPDWATDL